ncbi:MAG: response regulator [Flavisolibacter sp.]
MLINGSFERKLKLIVADDHHLFRMGIIMALKKINLISQIKEAENGKEVLELLQIEHFDVVLMDISMPIMNGFTATKEISKHFPKTKVIAVSMYEDDQHMIDMFHSGAAGYLFKNTDKEEIKNALSEVVFNENRYWPKKAGDKLFNKIILKKQAEDKSCSMLFSEREKEIIQLICQEYSTKEIASHLNLSQKTISWHRENLMQKTQTKNTAGLVAFAFTHELLEKSG